MDIWILSDGKQGHLNQSIGLANAIVQERTGTIHTISLADQNIFQKLRTVYKESKLSKPDLIISAGHSTHVPLIIAGLLTKAKTVLCMKPSLPYSLFDLCIVPRHDLLSQSHPTPKRVFSTVGAIHPIYPDPDKPKTITLILIGGPSKEFGWKNDLILGQLKTIREQTEGEIVLTTSRRTPDDFASKIKEEVPGITVVPVEETQSGWVTDHLSMAKAVWVSMDSVSMVYEALGSGAPVGILETPKKSDKSSRVFRGLQMLIEEDRVTLFDHWQKQNYFLTPQQTPLLESKRAAEFVLKTFFPKDSSSL